ncbi:MAG: 4-(cytidine 5'-diphospho)-2-C-methyl-D-erythritol kinase [Oscillospiraceae bacterium]|nr:4-(cytidine 5'-diphospho)-2-C-methyl-D-erythritol kinase [Oscillospiraceae bacterium]
MTVKAYAKVNLYLDITGIRADGYHEISTVMHTVSLCDDVTVNMADDIKISCDAPDVPCDERNTAYRCAAAFFDSTGIHGGAHIGITKRIPSQAGLGGGSADGAAVLRALNVLYDTKLTAEQLAVTGAVCGADIPFCVVGGCAYCGGIGEIMTSLPVKKGIVLIAKGSDGISTGSAYKMIDALGERGHIPKERIIADFSGETVPGGYSFNIFEEVTDNGDIKHIKKITADMGCPAMMTGSGSAVFAVFDDRQRAEEVCVRLRADGYFSGVYDLTEQGII